MNLNKLNCMNYYVYDHDTGDHWYLMEGLRSLFNISKVSNLTFREICIKLNEVGEVTIIDNRNNTEFTLTMI